MSQLNTLNIDMKNERTDISQRELLFCSNLDMALSPFKGIIGNKYFTE